jgi:hypothetical protein
VDKLPEKIDPRKQKRPAASFFLVNREEEKETKPVAEHRKLLDEIESWRAFMQALRLQDRQALNQLLEKIWAFDNVVENCKEGYETEAFLLSLLILQQKTIDRLERIGEKKADT